MCRIIHLLFSARFFCDTLWCKVSKGIFIYLFYTFVSFKVEQYLMLSEFENNINAELPSAGMKKDNCMVEHET